MGWFGARIGDERDRDDGDGENGGGGGDGPVPLRPFSPPHQTTEKPLIRHFSVIELSFWSPPADRKSIEI